MFISPACYYYKAIVPEALLFVGRGGKPAPHGLRPHLTAPLFIYVYYYVFNCVRAVSCNVAHVHTICIFFIVIILLLTFFFDGL